MGKIIRNIKYYATRVFTLPLLPLLYIQGKRIRTTVLSLPEASNPEGITNTNFKKTVNIIAIGESTIAGVGVATHKDGLTGNLAEIISKIHKVNVSWKVYARSGYTAGNVAKKIIPKIEEKDVDLFLIGLGANDAFKLNSPHKWENDITDIIQQLKTRHPYTPILFANMPPIKEFPAFTTLIKFIISNHVEILGESLQNITLLNKNVYYQNQRITLREWVEKHQLDINSSFFSDGVHPSELTYKIWAKDLSIFITDNQLLKIINLS